MRMDPIGDRPERAIRNHAVVDRHQFRSIDVLGGERAGAKKDDTKQISLRHSTGR